jgi:hypothetical protein
MGFFAAFDARIVYAIKLTLISRLLAGVLRFVIPNCVAALDSWSVHRRLTWHGRVGAGNLQSQTNLSRGLSDTDPRHHTGPVLHHMRAGTTATHHAPGTCAAHATAHRHRHHRHTATSGSPSSTSRHTSPTQP